MTGKAKALIQTAPEILDMVETVRERALALPDAEEYFPWGTRAYFRQMKGRNFLFVADKPDHLIVTLWVVGYSRDEALRLPYIAAHTSMGHKGWLDATIRTRAELDPVLDLIAHSHTISNPFRSPADVLPGEDPQSLEFLAQLRAAIGRDDDIEEFFPYGDRAWRPRKGQIFAYASERNGSLYVNVRLPLDEHEYALSLPFTDVPKYIGHKGWIGTDVTTSDELEMVLGWLPMSYEMNNPPRKGRVKRERR